MTMPIRYFPDIPSVLILFGQMQMIFRHIIFLSNQQPVVGGKVLLFIPMATARYYIIVNCLATRIPISITSGPAGTSKIVLLRVMLIIFLVSELHFLTVASYIPTLPQGISRLHLHPSIMSSDMFS